jgi:hypothetical protein
MLPQDPEMGKPLESRPVAIRRLEREIAIVEGCLDYEIGSEPNEYSHPLTVNKSHTELLDMLKQRKRELDDLIANR